ncbi:MAG: alpha/beta fold hydrolase [Dehalococcoidia bacterium]
MIERHFVEASGGRVHYRRTGSGPPLVLLHGLPRASGSVAPVIDELAGVGTVIAPDLPGYGLSDPLGLEAPSIDDYAGALLSTLDALGLGRVDLAGLQLGAIVALAVADRAPERIRTLTLDGLPAFDEDDRADLTAQFTPPLTPEWDGAHLVRAWAIRRDAYVFAPWYRRSSTHRAPLAFPDANALYDEVLALLLAGPEYPRPYQAAFRYDPRPALDRLRLPTLAIDRPTDLSTRLLGASAVSIHQGPLADAVREALDDPRAGPRPPAAPPPPARSPNAGEIVIQFGTSDAGPLLVRRAGGGEKRPLVLFHASPGTSASLEPLLGALDRPAFAFDTPGNGESAALTGEVTITGIAAVAIQALNSLGVDQFDVYGAHTGALVALEVALQQPDRARHLVLDGVPTYSPEEAAEQLAHHAPAMPQADDGSQLVWAWHLIRDRALWSPWHNRTPEGASMPRVRAPFPSPEVLHERVLEFLKGARTYHLNYAAVFRYPTIERLKQLRQPALAVVGEGSSLREKAVAAAAAIPNGRTWLVPGMGLFGASTAALEKLTEFLDGA